MGIGQLTLIDGRAAGQPLYESSATQVHALGTLATDGFGQYYRYAKAGGSALVAGNVIQAPAWVANHDQLTPSAASIGATSISVTLGATAATANQYAGGFAVIDTTPGEGQSLIISGHAAADASAAITLNLGQPLRVALTTSSRVSLIQNRYNGVIQSPATTLTGAIVGVCVYVIAASEYGWLGVCGTFGTLVGGTPAIGACVVSPGDTAGEVVVDPANAAVDVIGVMTMTGVDGKILPVNWVMR